MKKFIGMVAAMGMLAGCGVNTEDEFRAGLPSKAGVQVKVPGSGNKLLGEVAPWYLVTYGATTVVNGGVLAVLDILHHIVSNKPTSKSGNTYVWGPSEASNLEPNVWKLSVTDNKNGTYSYQLEGKAKGDPDSAFKVVLSGSHAPAKVGAKNDPEHGKGTFLLDWDARATLPAHGNEVGTADVTYGNLGDDVKVDVQFHNIKNDKGLVTDATYHYAQPKGGDGKFQFTSDGDIDNSGSAPYEKFTIESRWKGDGVGRSDVKVSGGSLGTNTAQASECWDTNFKETYYHDENTVNSSHFVADQGAETACAFDAAEFYVGN